VGSWEVSNFASVVCLGDDCFGEETGCLSLVSLGPIVVWGV
jgi:hypothetical protein